MSKMKYQIGDHVVVSIYQTEGTVVGIHSEKKKIYKVEIANHIILVGEESLSPIK